VTAPAVTNWTLESEFAGGGGTQGTDTGPSRVMIYSRVKDAGWSTMSAIATLTGANSSAAIAFGQLPGGGSSISTAVATGEYTGNGTAWSATMTTDPGITENDRIIIVCGNQSDGPTWSAQDLSVPGCTLTAVWERTEALEGITGQDVGGMICEFMVKSGTSTGAATFTATTSAASRGPTVLLRLRETGVPNNLVHGVEPEAAGGFQGPIMDGNGNLYRVTEEYLGPNLAMPEFGNHPMMMKSTDGGVTWKRMDAANGPGYGVQGSFNDMESCAIVQRTGLKQIEVLYEKAESRWWGCTFNTSDHPTAPDTWVTASIGTSAGVETFAATVARESGIAGCSLADGTVRAFVRGTQVSTFDAFSFRTKATTTWSSATVIDDGSRNMTRPQAVTGPSDEVLLAYRDDTNGQVRGRIISAAGSVGSSFRIDTNGAGAGASVKYVNNVVPPVYYDDAGTSVYVVGFVNASDLFKIVEIRGGTVGAEETVSTDTLTVNPLDLGGTSTDNEGPSAALAVIGTTLYAFWGEVVGSSGDVYYASRPNGGSWSARTLFADTGTGNECQWLYANKISATRVAVTYDIGRHFDDDSTIIYAELTVGGGATASPPKPPIVAGPPFLRFARRFGDASPATLTPVTPLTVVTTWNVHASITPKTVATTWNVHAAVAAKTVATTWNTRAAVTPLTVATTWNTRAPVTTTTATTWNVRSAVAKTLATTWNVRTSVAALTVATTWNVRSAITKTVATSWNVLAAVVKTIVTTWNVAGPPATAYPQWPVKRGGPPFLQFARQFDTGTATSPDVTVVVPAGSARGTAAAATAAGSAAVTTPPALAGRATAPSATVNGGAAVIAPAGTARAQAPTATVTGSADATPRPGTARATAPPVVIAGNAAVTGRSAYARAAAPAATVSTAAGSDVIVLVTPGRARAAVPSARINLTNEVRLEAATWVAVLESAEWEVSLDR